MSANCSTVRSGSCDRPVLSAGSISRSGDADGSQCETDEPVWYGAGVKTRTWPCASAPALSAGSLTSVTFTVPSNRAPLSRAPSSFVIRTDGIVIVGSAHSNRRAAGQAVGDHRRDRARKLRVLDLGGERARAPIDERDLAVHGGPGDAGP